MSESGPSLTPTHESCVQGCCSAAQSSGRHADGLQLEAADSWPSISLAMPSSRGTPIPPLALTPARLCAGVLQRSASAPASGRHTDGLQLQAEDSWPSISLATPSSRGGARSPPGTARSRLSHLLRKPRELFL